MNKHVENTKDQIVNTLQMLSNLKLTRIVKNVFPTSNKGFEILTWNNHVAGRHNSGKSFTTLNQYITIYETGAYHCILLDGSIVRVYFKFQENLLIQESLLYWPAPIIIPEDEVDELGIREALSMYLSDENTKINSIVMRSPFRFDYDSSNSSDLHPATHIHLQHSDCRISAKRPICFNTFIKFIFKYFYPQNYSSDFDDLDRLNYSGFENIDKSIMNL